MYVDVCLCLCVCVCACEREEDRVHLVVKVDPNIFSCVVEAICVIPVKIESVSFLMFRVRAS